MLSDSALQPGHHGRWDLREAAEDAGLRRETWLNLEYLRSRRRGRCRRRRTVWKQPSGEGSVK